VSPRDDCQRPPEDEVLLRHPVRVGFLLLVLGGLLYVLATIRTLLLVGFLAALFGTLLGHLINFLSRWMRRGWAVLLCVLLLFGGLGLGGYFGAPVVVAQLETLGVQIPTGIAALERWWRHLVRAGALSPLSGRGGLAETVATQASQKVAALVAQAVPAAFSMFEVALGLLLVTVLAFFLALEPASYRQGIRTLAPREHEHTVDELWERLGVTLKQWGLGIFVSMCLMGTLTAIGLLIVGVDEWFALGIITFAATFVPYAGAVASAIPGLIVALADSPTRFFYALGVYLMVHVVEGYLVEPMIMKRAIHLRPAVLLFWQMLMGGLFGVLGIVVATPLLACVKVAVDFLYVERKATRPQAETTPAR
jgi:predicted PurR-regulated permease PerM